MPDTPVSRKKVDSQCEPSSTFNLSPSHVFSVFISLLLLVLWCSVMIVVNVFWRLLGIPNIERCYFLFHTVCCRLFNLHCQQKGAPHAQGPVLFLSNHISYLDVFILGRSVPGFFIAKSEVSSWPVLGWLAKLQNTLFFERKSQKVHAQLTTMAEHFDQNGNLILFPEGTSTSGEQVNRFKSSLLQSVEQSVEEVCIQPITISYAKYKGKPMERKMRDQYAWYAKMSFAPHFFNALGLGRADIIVHFHPPVSIRDFSDRKACMEHCQQKVASALHH